MKEVKFNTTTVKGTFQFRVGGSFCIDNEETVRVNGTAPGCLIHTEDGKLRPHIYGGGYGKPYATAGRALRAFAKLHQETFG